MTLLLGALTSKAIVLGADGIEFRHAPGVPKYQDLLNRQKLFYLDELPIAVGIHGQNRLVPRGASLHFQRLAIEFLPQLIRDIDHEATVISVCRSLFDCLMPDVLFTFQSLAFAGISPSPMGVLVVGFDASRDRPRCYEAWWPLPGTAERPSVIEHPRDRRIPYVMHCGDGAKYALSAITHGGRYSVERLNKASAAEAQTYARALYKKADSLQPRDRIEFGGDYHEITITPDGAVWSFGNLAGSPTNPLQNEPTI